jgi:putative membrane protein
MVLDHGKARDELTSLAQSRTIPMPAELDARHKATRERLAKLSGEAFDRAYVEVMVADHQQAVTDFRNASQGGKDDGLKAWAAKTLPVLEGHLKMARDLNQSVGRPVGTSGQPVK